MRISKNREKYLYTIILTIHVPIFSFVALSYSEKSLWTDGMTDKHKMAIVYSWYLQIRHRQIRQIVEFDIFPVVPSKSLSITCISNYEIRHREIRQIAKFDIFSLTPWVFIFYKYIVKFDNGQNPGRSSFAVSFYFVYNIHVKQMEWIYIIKHENPHYHT